MKKHLFLSVFSVFFALFGGVVYADNDTECPRSIPLTELDESLDVNSGSVGDISNPDWVVYFNDNKTLYGTSFCSGRGEGATTPGEEPGSLCWCGLTRYYDGQQTFSPNTTTWWFSVDLGESCDTDCASTCYVNFTDAPGRIAENVGLCEDFFEECPAPIPVSELDGDFDTVCGVRPEDWRTNGINWEYVLSGGKTLQGFAFCSHTSGGDNATPSTLVGPHCWCGLKSYNDGSTTFEPGVITWKYGSVTNSTADCEQTCSDICYGVIDGDTCDFAASVGICDTSTTYNVTFSCNNGSNTTVSDGVGHSPGDTINALGSGRCAAPTGYTFGNWSCNNNIGTVSGGGTFTMPAADVVCTAQWTPNIYTIRLRNYNNTSTHSTIYEKYNTGWYKNAAATQVLTQASKPTRSGYTFRGFYTATQSDLTANGGSGTRVITQTGGLPANTTFTDHTYLYAAWARSCSAGTGCNCTLNINSNGTVTYATSAQSGYTLTSGSGTYAPVCSAINYTVSFAAGSGTGTMSSQTGKHIGDTITLPANGFTAPSGYVFNGWSCNNNIGNKAAGATFTMPAANVTCTAQWAQVSYPFTLSGTTTSSSAITFTFDISAAGTFYVNCGSYGTLMGDSGVSGNVITKNDATHQVFACKYQTGVRSFTISFGGLATAYTTSSNSYPAISFQSSASLISSVSGDLSAVFPYLGSTDGQYPRFIGTFNGASGLTSIPNTLFSSLTGSGSYMFSDTFNGCTGLTSIPSGLFNFSGNNVSGAESMFSSTFSGCTGLTGTNAIPSNLFSRVTSSAQGMFSSTFLGCTGLTSLPTGLFNFGGNSVAGAHTLFADTFENCSSLTTIPSGLFGSFTSGQTSMFLGTFNGCSNLTTLPDNLFSFTTNITGEPYMFATTFKDCTSLTSLPSGLFAFGNHTATGSESMFEETFSGCTNLESIPSTLFSKIISGGSGLFAATFENCTSLASIPSTLFNFNNNNTTGQSTMFSETFKGCTSLESLPDGLFARITYPADNMFYSTFQGCTGLTGYIPTDFFGGLIANGSNYATDMMTNVFYNTGSLRTTTTGCPSGMQQYITGYESYWNSHISCEAASYTITYYENSSCSSALSGLAPTTYTSSNAVSLPSVEKLGYSCNGWNGCTNGNISASTGWTAGSVTGNVMLYKNCTANNIPVYFDSNASSCNYGLNLNVPQPTRTGYVFTGWKICSLFNLNRSINGTNYGYINADGSSYNQDLYELSQTGTFAVQFNYGTLYGEARCSTTAGTTQGEHGSPVKSFSGGGFCWCGIKSYQSVIYEQCNISHPQWIYESYPGESDCGNNCATNCAEALNSNYLFRAAAFGQSQ